MVSNLSFLWDDSDSTQYILESDMCGQASALEAFQAVQSVNTYYYICF